MNTPTEGATVSSLSERQKLVCPKCGTDSACQCGVAPITRAEYALLMNPEKSDRAIAAEIGASPTTVGKARSQLSSGGQLDTVGKARRATGESSPVEKRVGLDGKARKMPEPPMTGWRAAVEEIEPLPVGFPRHHDLVRVKAGIERFLGHELPLRIARGSAEAKAVREAISQWWASQRPEEAGAAAHDELSKIEARVPLEKRERFSELLERARQQEIRRLQASFRLEVNRVIDAELATARAALAERQAAISAQELKLHEQQAELDARETVVLRREHFVVAHYLSYEEYQIVGNCLHPDRPERSHEKLNRAFTIWLKLKESVDWRTLKMMREGWKNGWSSFADMEKAAAQTRRAKPKAQSAKPEPNA